MSISDDWYKDESLLSAAYQQHGTGTAMAEAYGTNAATVYYWLNKRGLTEDPKDRPLNMRTRALGYEEFKGESRGEQYRLLHHKLLAVAEFGYAAVATEETVVHHINHIPWDNRPSNLTLMNRTEHNKLHANRKHQNVTTELKLSGEYERFA